MNCPYLNCAMQEINAGASHCPECLNPLKNCQKCNAPNRAFTVYCRDCGEPLADSEANWPMLNGGPRQLGSSRFAINAKLESFKVEELGAFSLSGWCQSLLFYDNYLFAFSKNGDVKVIDISQDTIRELAHFNVGAKIYSYPAIENGSLYVGSENHVHAYTLAHLFAAKESFEPRWELAMPGTPIKALIPTLNRLFCTLTFPDRRYEIAVVEKTDGISPSKPESLYKGMHLSSLAGNFVGKSKKVYFLSQEAGDMILHCVDYGQGQELSPEIKKTPVKGASSKFRKRIPIAVMGARLYFVFQNRNELCCLDAYTGEIISHLHKNVKEFVMAGINAPVAADATGLFIKKINKHIPFNTGTAIKGSPLILKNCAVVLGMQDGSVHFYDLTAPGLAQIWRVSDGPDEHITALAASKKIIAAGNKRGLVKICKLR